ncbi:TolC family protein, partial [Cupriavidus sp. SHE]
MKHRTVSRLMLLATLAAGGCAVGPDYVRPPVDVPQAYRFADEGISVAQTPATYWWSQMNDPVLDGLIATARANNKDLLIAAARVEEYYGRVMTTRSGLFPQVGIEAGGGRQRISTTNGTALPINNPFNQTHVAATASWEIDLFGRIRRLTEAAKADWQASELARRSTEISVVAATASAYITLRDLDNRL